jgi:hypothetical protein
LVEAALADVADDARDRRRQGKRPRPRLRRAHEPRADERRAGAVAFDEAPVHEHFASVDTVLTQSPVGKGNSERREVARGHTAFLREHASVWLHSAVRQLVFVLERRRHARQRQRGRRGIDARQRRE